MFDNVLIGIDGEQGGRDAIALARLLATPRATLALAHVTDAWHGALRSVVPGRTAQDQRAAGQLLERERSAAGVDAQLLVTSSTSPARGLHELAEERVADLLVLGSCRRGALGRATLGNDTRAGLDAAPCAVAVAPHGYAAVAQPFMRIGVGYDGSPESDSALAAARSLARRSGAAIRALHVVGAPNHMYTGNAPPAGEGVEVLVRAAQADMRALTGVHGEAVYGIPNEDLASFSRAVDLLVIGSRSYGPARFLIGGRTTVHLLAHSRAPVLVLPRRAPATVETEPVSSGLAAV